MASLVNSCSKNTNGGHKNFPTGRPEDQTDFMCGSKESASTGIDPREAAAASKRVHGPPSQNN